MALPERGILYPCLAVGTVVGNTAVGLRRRTKGSICEKRQRFGHGRSALQSELTSANGLGEGRECHGHISINPGAQIFPAEGNGGGRFDRDVVDKPRLGPNPRASARAAASHHQSRTLRSRSSAPAVLRPTVLTLGIARTLKRNPSAALAVWVPSARRWAGGGRGFQCLYVERCASSVRLRRS